MSETDVPARPSVYVETSVISYLTGRPSRDLIVAAHQQITREWWERRERFGLFVSEAVHFEARRGDPDAAARRLEVLAGLAMLPATQEAAALVERLVREHAMAPAAAFDAAHVALATVHRMDYLVTWNCTHIANAAIRRGIERTCLAAGFAPPVLCTPDELLGEEGSHAS